tara:strand:- start:2626 stop:3162 length:537 start_codon:yes stop_codon:yes gene_type:complete
MTTLLKKLKHYFSGEHEKNEKILITLFNFKKSNSHYTPNYWCLNNMLALNFKKCMTWIIFNIYNPFDKDTWKLSFDIKFTPDSYFSRVENKRTKEENKYLDNKGLIVRETMVVREISSKIQLLFIEFNFMFNFDYLLKYELSNYMKDDDFIIKYYRPSSLNINNDDDWINYRHKNNIL